MLDEGSPSNHNDFENCRPEICMLMHQNIACVNIASENLSKLLTDLKNELGNISNWTRIN